MNRIHFTPCEELVPKRHFWQMGNLRIVNFDNFGGLKSLLKFHIFWGGVFHMKMIIWCVSLLVFNVKYFYRQPGLQIRVSNQ